MYKRPDPHRQREAGGWLQAVDHIQRVDGSRRLVLVATGQMTVRQVAVVAEGQTSPDLFQSRHRLLKGKMTDPEEGIDTEARRVLMTELFCLERQYSPGFS
jgi:hypothetical protein